jgi:hypothetical protein
VALATETRLGSYEIVGARGAGGMGEVYRARDAKLNRDVALKVLSWADDTILLGLGGRGIARVSANGGTLERIVTVKGGELAHGPQTLPGGRAVMFTLATATSDDRWDRAKIVVQVLASGERKTLIDDGADARYLRTGHVVYARGGILFAIPFDRGRLAVVGGPVRIAEGVARAQGTSSDTGAAQFSVSNTGSLISLTGPTSTASSPRDLTLMDRKGIIQTLKLPSVPMSPLVFLLTANGLRWGPTTARKRSCGSTI